MPTPRPTLAAPPAGTGLLNGGFEIDWEAGGTHRVLIFHTDGTIQEVERENVFTPPGWTTWFRQGLPVGHDPSNDVGWAQPEVRITSESEPTRVRSGARALLFFTFSRIHDGGLLQQVSVARGARVTFSAWAHAWSSQDDDPGSSEGTPGPFYATEGSVADSDLRNFTFWVGIDPDGGTNPYAGSVVWGQGAHIYNAYHPLPTVSTTARSDTITVFLRSRTLWPFKHNDAYWDDAFLSSQAAVVKVKYRQE